MPCKLQIAKEVKEDILECDDDVCNEIDLFLQSLQNNCLPDSRTELEPGAYFVKLPSGVFISWEVLTPSSKPISPIKLDKLVVRILGVAREAPVTRKMASKR